MERLLKFVLQRLGVEPYRQKNIVRVYRNKRAEYSQFLTIVLLVFSVAVPFYVLWMSGPGISTDQWFLKQLFAIRGSIPPPQDVVLIGIDDESFAELNESPRWPLPRKHFAAALENVVAAEPKVIILDLTALVEERDPDADARIVAAMRRGKVTLGKGWIGQEQKEQMQEYVLLADPKFSDAAAKTLEMLLQFEKGVAWRIARYREGIKASTDQQYQFLPVLRDLAGYNIEPPEPQNLINFYGPPGTIHRVPFHQLVNPGAEQVASRLRDKIVLMGFQSVARMRGHMYQEEFAIPVSGSPMYGVEIFATIAGNLIEGSSIKRLPKLIEGLILFFVLVTIIVTSLILSYRLSLWKGIAIGIGLGVLYCALSIILFLQASFFLPGATLLMITLVAVVGAVSFLRNLSDRRIIHGVLTRFGIDDEKRIRNR